MPVQLIPLQLGGLDTKTHPFLVLPTKLLVLQNGIMTKTGAISKRWGYTALGTNILGTVNNITQCKAIQAFNNELMLFDSLNAYSYSQSENAWLNRGDVQSVIVADDLVIRNNNQQLSPDYCNISGVDIFVWEDSRGTLRYSAQDSTSQINLVTDQPLYPGISSSYIRPKCLPFSAANKAIVLCINAAGSIAYVAVSPNQPIGTTAPIIIINGADGYYDACQSNGSIFIAYYTQAQNVILTQFTNNNGSLTFVAQKLVVNFSGLPVGCISCAADINGNIYVTYGDAGAGGVTASTAVYQPTGGQLFRLSPPVQCINQSTGALQSIGTVGNVNGTLSIFAEAAGSNTYNNVIYQQTISSNGTLGGQSVFLRAVGLASKPFVYDNHGVYVNIAYQSNLQTTYFTVDSTGSVIAKINPGLAGGLISNSDWILPECQQTATGIFKFANLVRGIVNSEAGQIFSLLGVNATTLDFVDSNNFLSVAINQGLYTVGGIMQQYDGASYVETGYHTYPENVTLTQHATGGFLGTGTFSYAVTYEHIDNNGQNLPSTPSPVYTTTFASGSINSVTLQIPTNRLTRKSNMMIVVYRTTAGGTLLYRVTSALLPLYNDPTVDTVSFTDTLSDASIQSNGLMYTQPLPLGNSVLENAAPPSCSLITTFDDRIFIGGLEDANLLWFSQQRLPGVPMQFSASNTLQLDPDGGPITALARMDDKLIIFKQHAIFFISGQGPDATGLNSNFSEPIPIPTSVGCRSQNTVANVGSLGLMFDSGNGIYLLDRSLNVSYKGAPVEAFNNLTIESSTVIPNQWVIFTTTSGTALVYDYFYDLWGTFTNHNAVDSDLYLGNNNLFTYANANGTVYVQTPTAYSDNGAWFQTLLTTAWINPGTIQGFQRINHVFVLGDYKGTHTLNLAVAPSYNSSFTQYSSTNVDTALGMGTYGSVGPFGTDPVFGGGGPEQFVYQFRYDTFVKGEAIQIQISDQQSNPGNQGFTIAAITLAVNVKRGGMKLPKAKQIAST